MSKQSFLKKALVTSMALLAIPAAVMYTDYAISIQPDVEQSEAPLVLPKVSVMTLETGHYTARIQAFGEVRSADEITLTSQISGRVIWRNPAFVNGERVSQGAVLLKLDPMNYQVAVAAAEQELADAALALKLEKREQRQAQKDWHNSGLKETPGDMVLRKPQLRAAQARYRTAQANLDKARYDLAQTEVKTPFSALISDRRVSIGSYIESGVELAKLSSSEQAEISVSLTDHQWTLWETSGPVQEDGSRPVRLTPAIQSQTDSGFTAFNPEATEAARPMQWEGQVKRTSRFLDPKTRLRELVVTVDHPLEQPEPLLNGRFVSVQLSGKALNNTFRIPAYSLTADSYIWFAKQGRLQRQKVSPLFSAEGFFYIPQGELPDSVTLVRKPMSGYLPGMAVEVVSAEMEGKS